MEHEKFSSPERGVYVLLEMKDDSLKHQNPAGPSYQPHAQRTGKLNECINIYFSEADKLSID